MTYESTAVEFIQRRHVLLKLDLLLENAFEKKRRIMRKRRCMRQNAAQPLLV